MALREACCQTACRCTIWLLASIVQNFERPAALMEMPIVGSPFSLKRFRVLTYNVHRCLGADRRYAPDRNAEVIGECAADVVALQELDAGRKRSGGIHQAEQIAAALGMASLHYRIFSSL